MKLNSKDLVLISLLTVGLGFLLYLFDPYLQEYPTAVLSSVIRWHPGWLFFLLWFQIFCLLTLLSGLLNERLWLRCLTVLAITLVTTLHNAYSTVVKRSASLFDFELMQEEAVHTSDALQTYSNLYLGRVWIAGSLFLVLTVLAWRGRPRFRNSFFVLLPLCIVGFYAAVGTRENTRMVYPSVISGPLLFLRNTFSSRYYGPRDEVQLAAKSQPQSKIVVLLVDESVRGDLLSVNGYSKETTPLIAKRSFLNYGIATSAANCSAASNLILRSGLRPAELPDLAAKSLKAPNLFQYARKAGYRTVYIEGQRLGGNLHDYLNRFDLDYINDYYFMNKRIPCERSGDCFVIDKILKSANSEEPVFILAIKQGAHVPYEEDYPPTERIFTPTLTAGEPLRDRQRALNSYFNALRWSVDLFLEELIAGLAGKDYVIIYTSDHGQNILENNSNVTHCSKGLAPATEGAVPLFVFGGDNVATRDLEAAFKVKGGHASHYDIFPTLLRIFGFDYDEVRKLYGPSLMDRETYPPLFYAGSVFREEDNLWNEVSPESLKVAQVAN